MDVLGLDGVDERLFERCHDVFGCFVVRVVEIQWVRCQLEGMAKARFICIRESLLVVVESIPVVTQRLDLYHSMQPGGVTDVYFRYAVNSGTMVVALGFQ